MLFEQSVDRDQTEKEETHPAGKNDQVVSVETKVQIECGAPRLMIPTIAQPVNRKRRVSPVTSGFVESAAMNIGSQVVWVSRVKRDLNGTNCGTGCYCA